MSGDAQRFLGYHGTLRKSAINIKKNGFNDSKKGWLGEGVYFFQEDYDLALKWAQKSLKSLDVQFIKKYIVIEKEKLFDIVWPLSEDCKYYFKEREKFLEMMESRGYEVHIDNGRRYENELMNLICKRKEYDAVRACTYTYQKYDYKGGEQIDSIFANGVEICVRNHECILEG